MPERVEISVPINIDCAQLDEAIDKTDRLVGLLKEATNLICSLSRATLKKTDR